MDLRLDSLLGASYHSSDKASVVREQKLASPLQQDVLNGWMAFAKNRYLIWSSVYSSIKYSLFRHLFLVLIMLAMHKHIYCPVSSSEESTFNQYDFVVVLWRVETRIPGKASSMATKKRSQIHVAIIELKVS